VDKDKYAILEFSKYGDEDEAYISIMRYLNEGNKIQIQR
jgi:hypothetical protein